MIVSIRKSRILVLLGLTVLLVALSGGTAQASWVNVAMVFPKTPTLDAYGIHCRAHTRVIGNPVTTTRVIIQRHFLNGWGNIYQYDVIEESRYASASSRYIPGVYRCAAQVSFRAVHAGETIIKHSGDRHSHTVMM